MAVLSMGYAGSIGITMDHNPGCGTEAFDDITWQGEHFHLGTDVRETHVSTRWDLVYWNLEFTIPYSYRVLGHRIREIKGARVAASRSNAKHMLSATFAFSS
ncbi:hypothetical protein EDD15DRAFT_2190671 [Pisolithus albus]|nr:hypothetical protein EDD15DRAFT_2190671 [Pisolithus albus]